MSAAAPPPIATPPDKPAEVVVVSRDARSDILASLDTPLPLIKGRRTEDALLRQAISMASTLTVVRPAAGAGSGEQTLRWSYQAYLQRQLCLTSITGQFSCATAEAEELPEKASGEAPLQVALEPAAPVAVTRGQAVTAPASPAQAMPESNPAAAGARDAIVADLRDRAKALFDDDRRLRLGPMLKAAGVSVRRRPTAGDSAVR